MMVYQLICIILNQNQMFQMPCIILPQCMVFKMVDLLIILHFESFLLALYIVPEILFWFCIYDKFSERLTKYKQWNLPSHMHAQVYSKTPILVVAVVIIQCNVQLLH